MNLREIFDDTLMITGFVFAMMLLVEYLNVLSAGLLREKVKGRGLLSHGGVTLLGSTPGCLGAFTNVTLYVHRVIPFGALAGGMIATSGDEAFVMLAMFPGAALILFGILFVYGLTVGWSLDKLFKSPCYRGDSCGHGLALHPAEDRKGQPLIRRRDWSRWSLQRSALLVSLGLFLAAVLLGALGPQEWNWIRWSLAAVCAAAVWIVASVPDHFLEEHLYAHVAKEHVPRIFLWVLGVLLLMGWLQTFHLPVKELAQAHPVMTLLLAALIGIIPESGPHLIFVTLFAQGLVPFSVLVTSSIVQDGHGMLPLLAESRLEFVKVKAVNLAVGLALGFLIMAFGW
ncbi:MAG: putative manganese transporter [Acidobacteriota bacterium]|jgi:hypothetical protein